MQCVIGFGSFRHYRAWPDALVRRLRLLGDVFANAVARKRAEENTQRLRDQLARAARVTTMGELAAAIAHEINQPLCAIVSNAQAGQRLEGGGETCLVLGGAAVVGRLDAAADVGGAQRHLDSLALLGEVILVPLVAVALDVLQQQRPEHRVAVLVHVAERHLLQG